MYDEIRDWIASVCSNVYECDFTVKKIKLYLKFLLVSTIKCKKIL